MWLWWNTNWKNSSVLTEIRIESLWYDLLIYYDGILINNMLIINQLRQSTRLKQWLVNFLKIYYSFIKNILQASIKKSLLLWRRRLIDNQKFASSLKTENLYFATFWNIIFWRSFHCRYWKSRYLHLLQIFYYLRKYKSVFKKFSYKLSFVIERVILSLEVRNSIAYLLYNGLKF